jgi:alkaline ceramidase
LFRFFCPYWSSVGFPYLHGVWHVTIFLASYSAIVIFAYFDVKNHMVDKHPTLRSVTLAFLFQTYFCRYFPMDRFEFGVPFVFVQNKIGGRKEERSA